MPALLQGQQASDQGRVGVKANVHKDALRVQGRHLTGDQVPDLHACDAVLSQDLLHHGIP